MTREEIQTELAERKAVSIRQRHNILYSRYTCMQRALKARGVDAAFDSMPYNTRFNSKLFKIDANGIVTVNKFWAVTPGNIINDCFVVRKVDGKALRVQDLLTRVNYCISTEQIRSMR